MVEGLHICLLVTFDLGVASRQMCHFLRREEDGSQTCSCSAWFPWQRCIWRHQRCRDQPLRTPAQAKLDCSVAWQQQHLSVRQGSPTPQWEELNFNVCRGDGGEENMFERRT